MKAVTVKLTGPELDEPVRVLREGDTYHLFLRGECNGEESEFVYKFEVISVDV